MEMESAQADQPEVIPLARIIHGDSSRNRAVARRARLPGRRAAASRLVVAANPRLQQKRT